MSPSSSLPPARWTPEYGRRVVEELRRSGMSVDDFAQSRGFSAQRTLWLSEQNERHPTSSRRIVELVPAGERTAGGADDNPGVSCAEPVQVPIAGVPGAAPPLGLRILCPSGHVVVVDGGELTANLTAALRAVREAAC